MTIAPTQVLTAGKLPQSKYGEIPGFTAVRMIQPLTRMYAMLVGMRGCGKTSLIQSLPTGMTLNLDASSTARFIKGTVWPGVHPETGVPITNDGSQVILSWEIVRDFFQRLLDAASADRPRPTTLFIDSLDGLIPLVCDYVTRSSNKESFYEMDGRRAWGIAYDHITSWFNKLRQAYGLWLISHVVHRKLPMGEDQYADDYDLTLGDGLWKRVDWALELIGGIELETTTHQEEVQGAPIKRKDGTTFTPKPRTITHTVVTRNFYFSGGTYGEILKQRIGAEKPVALPLEDGWSALQSAYNALAI